MREVIMRPMTVEDAAAVAAVSAACFTLNWSEASFRQETENNLARYLVITEDDRVVGYAGMWIIFGSSEITSIAVLPECRRRGFGERMMRALMKLAYEELEITEMSLEVRAGNLSAQAMYTKLGFVPEGKRDRYYEDNKEDAIIMWCHDTRPYMAEERIMAAEEGE